MTPPTRALRFPEFVALLAMLIATIAFSIDSMLPALTEIGRTLAPEAANRAQLIVTIFMLGLGLGTLIGGPLSDTFGRKPVILAGIAVYIAAALVAAQAQSMETLLVARFVQGFGAAGPRVVTAALVRDLYAGRAMARVMSFVMTVFILVPVIAPSLGAVLIALWDWRAIFHSYVLFGLVAGAWLWLRQPETLPPTARRPLRAEPLLTALREVLRNRRVMTYTLVMALVFGQMFIWLSSTPQIFAEVYDRETTMPLWFAGAALFAALSSLTNAQLVMRLGMRRIVTVALACLTGASALMLAAQALPLPAGAAFALFFCYMSIGFFMIGLTFGNLNALALEPMGHIAGLAASVVGAVSTVLGVLIAVPAGLAYDGTVLPLVLGVLACTGLALFLMLRMR